MIPGFDHNMPVRFQRCPLKLRKVGAACKPHRIQQIIGADKLPSQHHVVYAAVLSQDGGLSLNHRAQPA